jgi:hypothetical protein
MPGGDISRLRTCSSNNVTIIGASLLLRGGNTLAHFVWGTCAGAALKEIIMV